MNLILQLFLTFGKIGLFTFGGGYAMIAMIENLCVEGKGWITHDELMDVTVLAESTPGPIAINCATFTGCRKAGFAGALAATLGIVTPSFLLICLLSRFLGRLPELPLLANALRGIRIAVGLLILDGAVTMIRKLPKKKLPRGIMICSCGAMLAADLFGRNLSSILLMLLAAAVSLAVFASGGAGRGKGAEGK